MRVADQLHQPLGLSAAQDGVLQVVAVLAQGLQASLTNPFLWTKGEGCATDPGGLWLCQPHRAICPPPPKAPGAGLVGPSSQARLCLKGAWHPAPPSSWTSPRVSSGQGPFLSKHSPQVPTVSPAGRCSGGRTWHKHPGWLSRWRPSARPTSYRHPGGRPPLPGGKTQTPSVRRPLQPGGGTNPVI